MSTQGPWNNVRDALDALDEKGRPKAPPLPEATDRDRAVGGHLAAIHRAHLHELVTIRRLMGQIERGEAEPAALVKAVPEMEMTRNLATFGNLCGRACAILSGHHNIEEHDTFVRLEAGGNDAITAVVAKLRTEHEVVHALLEHLYGAAVELVQSPGRETFRTAKQVFEQLEAVIKSHFGYEETELEEALGVFGAL